MICNRPMLEDIPHQVRITSKVAYRVAWVHSFEDPDKLGECCPNSKTITMLSGRPEKETRKTFVHEVAHAIAFEFGFDWTESRVQEIEAGVWAVLSRNKKWLKAMLKVL